MTIYLGKDEFGSLVGINLSAGGTIAVFAVIAAIYVLFHVFMAIGLSVVGKKLGLRYWGVAWIPIVNFYLMGKIAGKSNLFGLKIKNIGLWVMIFELLSLILTSLACGLYYSDSIAAFFSGEEIYFGYAAGYMLIPVTETGGEMLNAYQGISDVLYMIESLTSFVGLLFSITLFLDYFKRFVPEHYWLYALLAVFFRVTGLLVFIARKKEPVNFNEYMQNKYRKVFYHGVNPYDQAPPDDPFREYAQRGDYDPGDPFAELKPEEKKEDEPE